MNPINCTPLELDTFLQALEEGYLPTCSSDTDRCAPSRSMDIASVSFASGKETVTFPGFRFSLTSAHSTESLGAASSTWWREGSPAPISVLQEEVPGSKESPADFGFKWPGSFAKWHPHSRSWRTRQCSLLEDWTVFSETFPRWGMMRDGELWALPTPAALMAEIASGSLHTTSNWPTPTCADAYTDRLKSSQQQEGSMHSVNLSQAVNMTWTTPTVSGDYNRKGASDTSGDGLATQVRNEEKELAWPTPCAEGRGGAHTPGSHLSLEKAVVGWKKDGTREAVTERRCGPRPTPLANSGTGSGVRGEGGLNLQTAVSEERETPWASPSARDWKDSPGMAKEGTNPDGSQRSREDQLARQVNGVLNPNWEECLMCWPIGWTQAEPLPELNWPWRDFRGVVAFRGQPQHAWEPPRTVPKLKDRNKRVKAVGNGQDPSALVLAVKTLLSMNVPQLKRAA